MDGRHESEKASRIPIVINPVTGEWPQLLHSHTHTPHVYHNPLSSLSDVPFGPDVHCWAHKWLSFLTAAYSYHTLHTTLSYSTTTPINCQGHWLSLLVIDFNPFCKGIYTVHATLDQIKFCAREVVCLIVFLNTRLIIAADTFKYRKIQFVYRLIFI